MPIGYEGMVGESILRLLAVLACTAGFRSAETWSEHYATWGAATGLAEKIKAFIDGTATFVSSLGVSMDLAQAFIALVAVSFAPTSLDSGTRLLRHNIEEISHSIGVPVLGQRLVASSLAVVLIGFFAFYEIEGQPVGLALWSLFGSTNQVLGALTLLAVTIYLRQKGRNYLYTFLPMAFMLTVTIVAMVLDIRRYLSGGQLLLLGRGQVDLRAERLAGRGGRDPIQEGHCGCGPGIGRLVAATSAAATGPSDTLELAPVVGGATRAAGLDVRTRRGPWSHSRFTWANSACTRKPPSPSSPSEERFWPNSACFALQVVGFQRSASGNPKCSAIVFYNPLTPVPEPAPIGACSSAGPPLAPAPRARSPTSPTASSAPSAAAPGCASAPCSTSAATSPCRAGAGRRCAPASSASSPPSGPSSSGPAPPRSRTRPSAAQLVQAGVSPDDPSADLPRVDVDSLELVRPRSVGVEHVALWAMRQLRPPSLLEELGLSGAQRAAVLGSLVGRMAAPASERASWHWLRQRSALGEPLGCDCETMGRNALQRASDRLPRHRDTIETRLLQRADDLFDLQPTVTLHDRTSTCCEGAADRRPLARRGHSREKRHDCPPLTLGLALDASGFARRSRVLAGNVAEGGALQAMPTALDTPPEAAVVLDRGLATQGNVAWLRERGHRCLVASRERRRVFDASRAVAIGTAGGQRALACAETDGNGETRLRDRRAGGRQGPQRHGGGLEAAAAGGQRGDSSRGPRPARQQRRLGRRAAVAHLRDADRPGGRPPLPRERTGTAPDPPPQARAQRGPPVPVGARLPAGPGGPAAPAGGRGDGPLDDAAPSPGGPAAGDRGLPPGGRTHAARAQGDAGRVLAAGDPRASGRGRLAGRGPQAGRPAQTTKGTCTECSATRLIPRPQCAYCKRLVKWGGKHGLGQRRVGAARPGSIETAGHC